jgi:hypothetical protein
VALGSLMDPHRLNNTLGHEGGYGCGVSSTISCFEGSDSGKLWLWLARDRCFAHLLVDGKTLGFKTPKPNPNQKWQRALYLFRISAGARLIGSHSSQTGEAQFGSSPTPHAKHARISLTNFRHAALRQTRCRWLPGMKWDHDDSWQDI